MSPPRSSDGWYEHQPRRPGPSAPRTAGRKPFGVSWWGQAWVEALEQRARLDPNRLPRGRTYARTGAVGVLTLAPGEILADVQGSRRSPYKVRVRVRPFDEAEWHRLLDALAAEIGHTAALLDGELPAGVADDVRSVGLDLLPGAGELQPRCSCPDWADPCKHAAAVCYLVADALDVDPFGVLLLRGRGRDEVLAGLRSRRHADAPAPAAVLAVEPESDEGVPAPGGLVPRPEAPARRTAATRVGPAGRRCSPPILHQRPEWTWERCALWPPMPPPERWACCRAPPRAGLELTVDQDLARRAAALLADGPGGTDTPALNALARCAGLPGRELLRRALAFRYGGAEGLTVLDEAWDPGPAPLSTGRALLGPGATVRRNRVTLGERQFRLGRDGCWYPFRKDRTGRWNPEGAPITPMTDDEVGNLEDEADDR